MPKLQEFEYGANGDYIDEARSFIESLPKLTPLEIFEKLSAKGYKGQE